MGYLYDAARDIKNSIPIARDLYAYLRRGLAKCSRDTGYEEKLAAETEIYEDVADVHELPPIFHYWSNKHLRPMLEELGFSNPDEFFAKYLGESARRRGTAAPIFLSLGAGNCDTEIRVARLLRKAGIERFTVECVDLNQRMLERGLAMAQREGVAEHIVPVEGDFNQWRAAKQYDAVMANQSLHHVLNLEGLFDEVKRSLATGGCFVVSDIIGRNGHQRWPEALAAVQRFWRELPHDYRYNRQLGRYEHAYRNWDCSGEGFEGIRAQDILPLLLQRFEFHLFVGFANVIDLFVDRSFGPNFDADAEWDRGFIDRVHAFDEAAFRKGELTPTHMMAVLTPEACEKAVYARGLGPEESVRRRIVSRLVRSAIVRVKEAIGRA
jgi:SAM-dependent methyltransferase